MSLNPQKGNMYGFITHTWNPIKGACIHQCEYCYARGYAQLQVWLDEKCFLDNLGEGKFIFLGSATDMFSERVKTEWIKRVLHYCQVYPKNEYLLQSKNPHRFLDDILMKIYDYKFILCTTIETNRQGLIDKYSKAPSIENRILSLASIESIRKMITIEPIMDFDLQELRDMIWSVQPESVNIGADSKGHGLPEPSREKVQALITELGIFTKVHLKDNLKRLLPEESNEITR
jgi:DNA repair photolyase